MPSLVNNFCARALDDLSPRFNKMEPRRRFCNGRELFSGRELDYGTSARGSKESDPRFHFDRTAGGYRNHCDSRQFAASGFEPGEGKGAADRLPKQSTPMGHCDSNVRSRQ